MEMIEIHHVSKKIKDKDALSDISLQFVQGENTAIIGETGSGKSTLLRTIAGLVQPDEGKVYLNGKKVLGPEEKLIAGHDSIAYLSQHFELPIHLRVEQVLEYANTLKDGEEKQLYEICHIGHLMKRKTHELSGGEKQRIALVRLLLGKPQVLLLDEPFSNFDNIHKNEMMQMVQEIAAAWSITCLMVSHSPKDVLFWSQRIIAMRNSVVQQDDTPENIYRKPNNEYVAGLLGDYNILTVPQLHRTGVDVAYDKDCDIMIRPESFHVVLPDSANMIGKILEKHFLGFGYQLIVDVNGVNVKIFTQYQYLQVGNMIHINLSENDMTVVD
ncbi:MAG: ABC transporter ATP-binding protein [Pseudopedobacter saltans]|uniref:ABC transporter ATP-binding protein n=1 Tax=Pseudopedobacter saltans TaxID=151895 RepID=A0A2W5F5A5_9SPHI|nr:MAG: ABC transporter ATP-binding protein [Pseudopedobacter saltans]